MSIFLSLFFKNSLQNKKRRTVSFSVSLLTEFFAFAVLRCAYFALNSAASSLLTLSNQPSFFLTNTTKPTYSAIQQAPTRTTTLENTTVNTAVNSRVATAAEGYLVFSELCGEHDDRDNQQDNCVSDHPPKVGKDSRVVAGYSGSAGVDSV